MPRTPWCPSWGARLRSRTRSTRSGISTSKDRVSSSVSMKSQWTCAEMVYTSDHTAGRSPGPALMAQDACSTPRSATRKQSGVMLDTSSCCSTRSVGACRDRANLEGLEYDPIKYLDHGLASCLSMKTVPAFRDHALACPD